MGGYNLLNFSQEVHKPGLLNGPYCPIYGPGALLVILLLGDIKNPVALFFAAAVVTSILEYITSWAMEKLFHARWWDYSQKRFNINGRVYLLGAAAFGTLSVIVVKLLHPAVAAATLRLPELAISVIALALFALMLIDLVYTVTRLSEFNVKLKELNDRLAASLAAAEEQRKAFAEKLQSHERPPRPAPPQFDWPKRINHQERRLIKAFPKLRSTRYNDALEKLKKQLHNKGSDEAQDEPNGSEQQ